MKGIGRVNATRKQKKGDLKVRVCVTTHKPSLDLGHNSKSKLLGKRTLPNTAMHIVFALLVKAQFASLKKQAKILF